VLEYLERGYCGDISLYVACFKAAGEQIVAIPVMPVEIESDVTHQPCQHAITTSGVDVSASPIKTPVQERRELACDALISRYQASVCNRNRIGIRFFKPVRLLGLKQATTAAIKVINGMFL
jgi:hypothetical protein